MDFVCRRWVYFNGDFVREEDAKISIYDSALMFGDLLFEMTRSFNKEQFKLRNHLERLYASAKYTHLEIPISIEEMEECVYKTIEINEPSFASDDEHRVMINVSRGLLSIYQDIVGVQKGPNVIIADFPLRWTVAGMGKLFDKGINAVIPSQRAIPANLLEPKVKNRSRMHYLMANIEVSKYKGDNNWALLLDPDGFITEGTGDNFFIVKDNTIITPEPRNILRGISREYIFELAKFIGWKCIEKNIEPYDVITADEAFMTGTPFCMLPVTSLNGIKIGDGKVKSSSMFNHILSTWSGLVNVNIKKQIQNWDMERKIQNWDMERNKTDKMANVSPYSFGGKENA